MHINFKFDLHFFSPLNSVFKCILPKPVCGPFLFILILLILLKLVLGFSRETKPIGGFFQLIFVFLSHKGIDSYDFKFKKSQDLHS